VSERDPVDLRRLERCFAGAIPAVVCTRSAAGEPNITYLSKVEVVDEQRVALSNQFLSKTAMNLAEHPHASVLLLDPANHDEYRLTLAYERTERRGRVFEQLRRDVDAIAALSGMQDVFRLRAADIYRVVDVEVVPANQRADGTSASGELGSPPAAPGLDRLAELSARISRCADLDTLVRVTVDGLVDLLGYEHTALLLLDEAGERLFTIASRGFDAEGVGSEVALGEGVVGLAAAQGAPVRVGNLLQMGKYSRTVRRSFEATGEAGPGHEVPVPVLGDADSRLAVPCLALGQLVGVLVTESRMPAAFSESDEAALTMVASIVAVALEAVRAEERSLGAPAPVDRVAGVAPGAATSAAARVRFFEVDGSTFLDGD
jgi:adenylate cyclase